MSRTLKVTPNAYFKFRTEMYQRLEKSAFPAPEIDLHDEITFFNNKLKHADVTSYDQFFSYAKPFPIFDQRKHVENRKYPFDIWSNIYEQEKNKAVPATTSLNYGHRTPYDNSVLGIYKYKSEVKGFYRRNGLHADQYQTKFTEEADSYPL